MKTLKPTNMIVGLLIAAVTSGTLTAAPALAARGESSLQASVLGGVQGLRKNDTALQDNFVNIPVAASLAYRASSIFVVEGELAWMIPVKNSVKVGLAGKQDLKNPDVLSYQANVRAECPRGTVARPYATAGVGAMTFLSTTDGDRYPRLSKSETAFAINFGLGASLPVAPSLSLRGDFREFVAFPKEQAAGLSNASDADPIWMPRGTVGLTYLF